MIVISSKTIGTGIHGKRIPRKIKKRLKDRIFNPFGKPVKITEIIVHLRSIDKYALKCASFKKFSVTGCIVKPIAN